MGALPNTADYDEGPSVGEATNSGWICGRGPRRGSGPRGMRVGRQMGFGALTSERHQSINERSGPRAGAELAHGPHPGRG